LHTLPVLDVTALKPKQVAEAVKLFDEISETSLLSIHEIDADTARGVLDTRFTRDVLGLPSSIFGPGGPLELLRMKLSREPSIRGNK
jgi:hypothetical protein